MLRLSGAGGVRPLSLEPVPLSSSAFSHALSPPLTEATEILSSHTLGNSEEQDDAE